MLSLSNTIAKLREVADTQPDYYREAAEELLSPNNEDGSPNKIYKKIVAQVEEEYTTAWAYAQSRMRENLARLRLYNNQRRDKTKVGDPFLFTMHQTVLAALYYDRLEAEAEPREEGDVEVAAAYNGLMEFDYTEMRKAELDYETADITITGTSTSGTATVTSGSVPIGYFLTAFTTPAASYVQLVVSGTTLTVTLSAAPGASNSITIRVVLLKS